MQHQYQCISLFINHLTLIYPPFFQIFTYLCSNAQERNQNYITQNRIWLRNPTKNIYNYL